MDKFNKFNLGYTYLAQTSSIRLTLAITPIRVVNACKHTLDASAGDIICQNSIAHTRSRALIRMTKTVEGAIELLS